ncbi:M1 family metallopeptidase [Alloacidobacterium dinghuense]|uniref:Aminopeptidase n=1 Tax=Alloacidobacterium dinghuense TaxID=2763107 RepID=A0A7G8BJT2_9BACT|nr:M1 family metallopeptidase [Alloacidobacterium dinghuense]QNI32802.1 M1 family metallopeptidase [Alloacidobacterium dinghuense]
MQQAIRRIAGFVCCATACLVLGTVFSPNASAQRLPDTVRPEHYGLILTPDLKSATFTGTETIDVQIQKPVDSITLNAIEIKFQSVKANLNGKTLEASVTEDTDKQQATFHFNHQLPTGKLTLAIEYTGILNNELRGFYLSKTEKRNYAVTQFESTDARRAFPSFDEPAFKATYDVTLVVDKGDTAISNTNVVSDTAGPSADKHTIKFATTPKMSTYLVAFLVGDFQCTSGESDGVPIRACATPDKVELGKYSVKAAEFVLHYYDTYFGIKYPMPKLDMIAIPDFEAGAMENFGAITYRETDLLIDEKTASVGAKKNVAEVVAHEMAHQWFGDMVTMQWWDNIWLNEGFATWMENKPVAAWHLEWNIPQDVAAGLDNTLNYDAQRVTRTIRAKADTPDQINEMFDGISYGKAGAVLLMVENYLGEETFRRGVHNYLAAHMYGNATAEDFWNAQTAESHKPVDKIMESFVAQPGVPVLNFSAPQADSVAVNQQRFFLSPSMKADQAHSWTVPVCMKSSGGKENCEMLSASQQSLKTPKSGFFFANAEGKGYYRSTYPADVYAKIVDNVESGLTPEERIGLLGDVWAQVRADKMPVGDYLNLAAAVKDDSSGAVVRTALSAVETINARVADSDEERDALAAWVRKNFKPAYERLGEASDSDTPEKKELRATLFAYLGTLGKDPDVIAQAKQIAEKYLADPSSVEGTFAQTATGIAAVNGDPAFFDQLQQTFETSANPQLQETALRLLAEFKDQSLEHRALDFTVSGKVRNQDAAIELLIMLRARETRDQAWQYIQQNWDKVQAQLTTAMGGYLVSGTGNFCSAEARDQVVSFFDTHKVPASEHALARAKNQINDCIELRAAQQPKLREWIPAQKSLGGGF